MIYHITLFLMQYGPYKYLYITLVEYNPRWDMRETQGNLNVSRSESVGT